MANLCLISCLERGLSAQGLSGDIILALYQEITEGRVRKRSEKEKKREGEGCLFAG